MTTSVTVNQFQPIQVLRSIQDNYTGHAESWFRYMDQYGKNIDADGIRDYFLWLNSGSHYKANTVNVKRSAVKVRLRAMYESKPYEERQRLEDTLKRLDKSADTGPMQKNGNGQVSRDMCLTPLQVELMVERAKTGSGTYQDGDNVRTLRGSDKTALIIRFLFNTGCRISEMITAELSNCKPHKETHIKILVTGKRKKQREVKIRKELYEAIREEFHGQVYLFETKKGNRFNRAQLSRQITRVGETLGYRVSAHIMRHSFATATLDRNPGKIKALSTYLGHSQVSTTLTMYVHDEMGDDELDDIAI